MTTPATGTATRSPRLSTALVCSGVIALVLTALALYLAGLGLYALQSPSTADRGIGTVSLVIAVVVLAPIAVLMWVALGRLATQPPRGARLMIGCLTGLGGFVLVVVLPPLARTGSLAVSGATIGIGLAFLGVAHLVHSATRATA
jgi:FtsH-binding integral membrane protein